MKKAIPHKIICMIVAVLFLINDVAYALSPSLASSDITPRGGDVRGEAYALGRKLFATKIGGWSIDWDEYSTTGFTGEVPQVSYIKKPGDNKPRKIDYNDLSDGMEESTFFNNVNSQMRDPKTGKISLIKAARYFRDYEALIPGKFLEIQEGRWNIEEEAKGELGIARIEKIGEDRYVLIIHSDFVERLETLLENDVVEEVTFPDGEKRIFSTAWALFFRLMKHEMTDLEKNGLATKGNISHITYYPGLEDIRISKSEIQANSIQGRFAAMNDAAWMWFLGSYAFDNATRYNNNYLRQRLEWFFNDKDKNEDTSKLKYEFPNLLEDAAKREEAIKLALYLNHAFFGVNKGEAVKSRLERSPQEKRVEELAYIIAADSYYESALSKGADSLSLSSMTSQAENRLFDHIERMAAYIILQKELPPDVASTDGVNIRSYGSPRAQSILRISQELDRRLRYFAFRTVREIYSNNTQLLIKKKVAEQPLGLNPIEVTPTVYRTRATVSSTEMDAMVGELFFHITGNRRSYLTSDEFFQKLNDGYRRVRLDEEAKLREEMRRNAGITDEPIFSTGGGGETSASATKSRQHNKYSKEQIRYYNKIVTLYFLNNTGKPVPSIELILSTAPILLNPSIVRLNELAQKESGKSIVSIAQSADMKSIVITIRAIEDKEMIFLISLAGVEGAARRSIEYSYENSSRKFEFDHKNEMPEILSSLGCEKIWKSWEDGVRVLKDIPASEDNAALIGNLRKGISDLNLPKPELPKKEDLLDNDILATKDGYYIWVKSTENAIFIGKNSISYFGGAVYELLKKQEATLIRLPSTDIITIKNITEALQFVANDNNFRSDITNATRLANDLKLMQTLELPTADKIQDGDILAYTGARKGVFEVCVTRPSATDKGKPVKPNTFNTYTVVESTRMQNDEITHNDLKKFGARLIRLPSVALLQSISGIRALCGADVQAEVPAAPVAAAVASGAASVQAASVKPRNLLTRAAGWIPGLRGLFTSTRPQAPTSGVGIDVKMSNLADHRLLNKMLELAITQLKDTPYLRIEKRYKDAQFFWFGQDGSQNLSFEDLFNILADKMYDATSADKAQKLMKYIFREAGFRGKIVQALDDDDVKGFKAQLRCQFEHFGVGAERNSVVNIYSLKGYEKNAELLYQHVKIEKDAHWDAIDSLFGGSRNGYDEWRKSNVSNTNVYNIVPQNAETGMIDTLTAEYGRYFRADRRGGRGVTYNEFGSYAHMIAEKLHPVAHLLSVPKSVIVKARAFNLSIRHRLVGTQYPTAGSGATTPSSTPSSDQLSRLAGRVHSLLSKSEKASQPVPETQIAIGRVLSVGNRFYMVTGKPFPHILKGMLITRDRIHEADISYSDLVSDGARLVIDPPREAFSILGVIKSIPAVRPADSVAGESVAKADHKSDKPKRIASHRRRDERSAMATGLEDNDSAISPDALNQLNAASARRLASGVENGEVISQHAREWPANKLVEYTLNQGNAVVVVDNIMTTLTNGVGSNPEFSEKFTQYLAGLINICSMKANVPEIDAERNQIMDFLNRREVRTMIAKTIGIRPVITQAYGLERLAAATGPAPTISGAGQTKSLEATIASTFENPEVDVRTFTSDEAGIFSADSNNRPTDLYRYTMDAMVANRATPVAAEIVRTLYEKGHIDRLADYVYIAVEKSKAKVANETDSHNQIAGIVITKVIYEVVGHIIAEPSEGSERIDTQAMINLKSYMDKEAGKILNGSASTPAEIRVLVREDDLPSGPTPKPTLPKYDIPENPTLENVVEYAKTYPVYRLLDLVADSETGLVYTWVIIEVLRSNDEQLGAFTSELKSMLGFGDNADRQHYTMRDPELTMNNLERLLKGEGLSSEAHAPKLSELQETLARQIREIEALPLGEIIDEYALSIGVSKGSAIDEVPLKPKLDEIQLSEKAWQELAPRDKDAVAQRVEIYLTPSKNRSLTGSVNSDIRALNRRIRERKESLGKGEDAEPISIKPFDENTLKNLKDAPENVRRIFINDSTMTEAFRALAGKNGFLKDKRFITIEIPEITGDEVKDSVHQAWLLKVAILSALLRDDNKSTIGVLLKEELENRLSGPNANAAEFIEMLAKDEKDVSSRVEYFLGTVARLSTLIATQLRILKSFWTAA